MGSRGARGSLELEEDDEEEEVGLVSVDLGGISGRDFLRFVDQNMSRGDEEARWWSPREEDERKQAGNETTRFVPDMAIGQSAFQPLFRFA